MEDMMIGGGNPTPSCEQKSIASSGSTPADGFHGSGPKGITSPLVPHLGWQWYAKLLFEPLLEFAQRSSALPLGTIIPLSGIPAYTAHAVEVQSFPTRATSLRPWSRSQIMFGGKSASAPLLACGLPDRPLNRHPPSQAHLFEEDPYFRPS
jgi:hypothetical protein